jgi:hypothetical protein
MNRTNIKERGSEPQKFSTKNSLHLKKQRVCTVQRVEGAEAESKEKNGVTAVDGIPIPIEEGRVASKSPR